MVTKAQLFFSANNTPLKYKGTWNPLDGSLPTLANYEEGSVLKATSSNTISGIYYKINSFITKSNNTWVNLVSYNYDDLVNKPTLGTASTLNSTTAGQLFVTLDHNNSTQTNQALSYLGVGTFARTLLQSGETLANVQTSLNIPTNTITELSNKQPLDADLTAIAALAGTSGLARKTAANTWSLDTSSYLTANQTITVSGDVSGSGTTSINLVLNNSGISNGTYLGLAINGKGIATGYTPVTTLSGYGITDAAPLTHVGSGGSAHLLADGSNHGFMSSSDFTKLTEIASGATANQSDPFLLNRTNHIGTQAQSTIVGLESDLAAKQTIANLVQNLDTPNTTTYLSTQALADELADIIAGQNYLGEWNSNTNTPTIVSSVGVEGDYYVVSVASSGVTTIDGNNVWTLGDEVLFADGVWKRKPNFQSVTSVAGKTGAVTLVKADVGLSNVDNTSDANKPISTAAQTALDLKENLLNKVADLSSPNTSKYIHTQGLTTVLGNYALGAASSVDNEIVLFSGTSGKQLKRGGVVGDAAYINKVSSSVDVVANKALTTGYAGLLSNTPVTITSSADDNNNKTVFALTQCGGQANRPAWIGSGTQHAVFTLPVNSARGLQLTFSPGTTANKLSLRTYNAGIFSSWVDFYNTGNLLDIGTTASSARTALELGTVATYNVATSFIDPTSNAVLIRGYASLGLNGGDTPTSFSPATIADMVSSISGFYRNTSTTALNGLITVTNASSLPSVITISKQQYNSNNSVYPWYSADGGGRAGFLTVYSSATQLNNTEFWTTANTSANVRTMLSSANNAAIISNIGAAPLNDANLTGNPTAPTQAKGYLGTRIANATFVRDAGLQYAQLTGVSANTILTHLDTGKVFLVNGAYSITLPLISAINANGDYSLGRTITFRSNVHSVLTANIVTQSPDVIRSNYPDTNGTNTITLKRGETIVLSCDSTSSWYVIDRTFDLALIATSGSATDLITGTVADARLPTTMAGKTFTSDVVIADSAPVLRLQDTDSPSSTMQAWVSFRNNSDSEAGWVGFGTGDGRAKFRNLAGAVELDGLNTLFYSETNGWVIRSSTTSVTLALRNNSGNYYGGLLGNGTTTDFIARDGQTKFQVADNFSRSLAQLIVRKDCGASPSYDTGQMMLESTGANPVSLGFHRNNNTAAQLYHNGSDGELHLYANVGTYGSFYSGVLTAKTRVDIDYTGAVTPTYNTNIGLSLTTTANNKPAISFHSFGINALILQLNPSTNYLEVRNSNNTVYGNFKADNVQANSFTGSGASITGINASNISAGILADARLPTSMAGKTFTGNTIFNSATNTNYFYITRLGGTTQEYARFGFDDSGLKIYHNNDETTSTITLSIENTDLSGGGANANSSSVSFIGNASGSTVSATFFNGSGANLNNLNASNVSSGTLNNARLNIVSSLSDTTVDKILTTGYGGLGGTGRALSWSTPGGGFLIDNSGFNPSLPTTSYFGISCGRSNNSYATQLAGRNGVFFLRSIENSVVGTAFEVKHSGNILDIGTTDSSARSALNLAAIASSGSASDLTTGTISVARLPYTFSSTNSNNTAVLRDNAGSFSANTVTASSFVGNGGNLSGLNASALSFGTVSNSLLNLASTSSAGIVQLNNTTSSTSTSQAATANAVKLTMDVATAAQSTANTANNKIDSLINNPKQLLRSLGNVSGSVSIDCNLGTHITLTVTGSLTLSFTNTTSATEAMAIVLEITNGGNYGVTLPAGTRFTDGSAITFTTNGTDVLTLTKTGSANFRAYLSSKDSK